jgi:hypothetical protein
LAPCIGGFYDLAAHPRSALTLNIHTAQLSAFLTNVGDLQDGPVRADDRADIAPDAVLSTHDATGPDRKTPALRVAVIGANQIERDGFIGELAKTHPELTAIAFATVSECVGFSADPDVIMLRVRQGTSTQIALEYIAQLRSSFPGVPVTAITAE